MLDRLLSLVVSVSLAFLVWLYVRSRDQEVIDNVTVPVTVTLAPRDGDHFDLELNGPAQVTAAFTGPPSRIRDLRGQIQRGELGVAVTYTVPQDRLCETRFLDTIRIGPDELHPPPGVRATVSEAQNRIPVTVRRLAERHLPVRLDHALDDRISHCVIEPANVIVRGPQDVLDRIDSIPTRPYALPPRVPLNASTEVRADSTVALVDEVEGRPVRTTPGGVTVRVTIRPRSKIHTVQVPVTFLVPADYPFKPQWAQPAARGMVTLKVRGPVTEEAPLVRAFVDLTGPAFAPVREPGRRPYADEPIRVQLPRDFQLAQPLPNSEAFSLVPTNSTTGAPTWPLQP